ncbi:MAG: DUF1810 domain-containing protein [Traorella sp.]
MEYSDTDLERFVAAHQRLYNYAYQEIQNKKKATHWMWFIFPNIAGLGKSAISYYYSIKSIDETKKDLKHPLLCSHLNELSSVLIELEGVSAIEIFKEVDARKLMSCMTLFYLTSSLYGVGNQELYKQVLDKYYNGKMCEKTKQIFNQL